MSNDSIQTFDQLAAKIKLFLRTRQSLVIMIVGILVALGLAWFGILPQWQTTQEKRDNLLAAQADLEVLETKKTTLTTALAQVSDSDVELIDNLLPSYKPILEIIYALGQARSDYPVTFTRLSFSPGEIATDSATTTRRNNREEKLTMDLDITGRHNILLDFLQRIETMTPLSSIATLDLSKRDDGFSSAKIQLSIFYDTKKVAVTTTSKVPVLSPANKDTLSFLRDFSILDAEQLNYQGMIEGDREDIFGFDPINIDEIPSF